MCTPRAIKGIWACPENPSLNDIFDYIKAGGVTPHGSLLGTLSVGNITGEGPLTSFVPDPSIMQKVKENKLKTYTEKE